MSKPKVAHESPADRDEEAERKHRTLIMVGAIRAAVDAFERTVVEDATRVRGILRDLEVWAGGGPAPARLERFPALCRERFDRDDGSDAPPAIDEEWDRDFCAGVSWHIMETAISASHGVAIGEPLDTDTLINHLCANAEDHLFDMGELIEKAVLHATGGGSGDAEVQS